MADAPQTTATDDVIAQLKALDRALVGRTVSDDEMIGGVCESAIQEIQRLRAGLRIIAGESRGVGGLSHSDIARITLHPEGRGDE